MCYEYDDLFEWARRAEQMRKETKLTDQRTSPTPNPAKPVEPEPGVKEQQPVPA